MMARFLATALLVPCVILASCVAPSGPPFRPAIEAANRELMDRYNRGDRVGVARLYEDTALMISDRGERISGREAIEAYWAPRDRPPRPSRWTLEVISLEGTDQMPVQRGRSILETEWEGQRRVSDVQFLVVWRRQADGSYRIAVDAWWPTGR